MFLADQAIRFDEVRRLSSPWVRRRVARTRNTATHNSNGCPHVFGTWEGLPFEFALIAYRERAAQGSSDVGSTLVDST